MKTREQRRCIGAKYRRLLQQKDDNPVLDVPSYRNYVDEFYHGTIGARQILPIQDRMIPVLTALCLQVPEKATVRVIKASLDQGIAPRGIVEIFIQSSLYAGIAKSEEAIEIAQRVFTSKSIKLSDDPQDDRSLDNLEEEGVTLMNQLHGARQNSGYASPDDPMTYAIYKDAIRYGYGNLWLRPGLTIRQRMLCAIAGFTTLGLHNSLKKFAVSALNVGLTKEETVEAALQTAPWNSLPVALSALSTINEAYSIKTETGR